VFWIGQQEWERMSIVDRNRRLKEFADDGAAEDARAEARQEAREYEAMQRDDFDVAA
jgi:hypothetical protein